MFKILIVRCAQDNHKSLAKSHLYVYISSTVNQKLVQWTTRNCNLVVSGQPYFFSFSNTVPVHLLTPDKHAMKVLGENKPQLWYNIDSSILAVTNLQNFAYMQVILGYICNLITSRSSHSILFSISWNFQVCRMFIPHSIIFSIGLDFQVCWMFISHCIWFPYRLEFPGLLDVYFKFHIFSI